MKLLEVQVLSVTFFFTVTYPETKVRSHGGKEVKEEKKDVSEPMAAILKELGAPAAPKKADTEQIPVLKWKGVEYLLRTKPNSGGLVFNIFGRDDLQFRKILGELPINPGTGTLDGSTPSFRV